MTLSGATMSETVSEGSECEFSNPLPNPALCMNPVVAGGGDVSVRRRGAFSRSGQAGGSVWVEMDSVEVSGEFV